VSPSRFDIGYFNETSKAQNSICPQKLANFLGIEIDIDLRPGNQPLHFSI